MPHGIEWERPEILVMIPETAGRILDLGCGGGRFGESLKRRQTCEVWGVERDEESLIQARSRIDHVLAADLSDVTWEVPAHFFDVIVCLNVLEHLRQPRALLDRCKQWLAPGGQLIVNIHNSQHHSVITGLLNGNFTYESAGLFAEDRIRSFTRREIEKLLDRSGYQVQETQIVLSSGWNEWLEQGQPNETSISGLSIKGLSLQRAADFFAYQFLLRAEVQPTHDWGLTSIIIVTHNQWNYTQQCLASLRSRTDEPYELIVVDNGSKDGTPDYLRCQSDIILVENSENRGFPAAVNQGIAVASGRQILLLNNDTLVATGWLRRMLTALRTDPQIGLVGPVSNCVSGSQQVAIDYRDLSSLDGFAWEWGKQHSGQLIDLERLVGFCLLLRREVQEQIGGFDERFGIGNFEDDDYCRRARDAGFRTVVAVDSFVHHFGGQSFRGSGIDFADLMAKNAAKFAEKWRDAPSAIILHPEAASTTSLPPSKKLSLCMIVRDNANTIRPCLESIRPWVDEMIVIDTGSQDATPEICQELGANVHHWPWCDDFSAARNKSLKHATGEWIFWMDSDDTIPPECGRQLQALVQGRHAPEVLGYVMQVHCPGPATDGQRDLTIVDHIKLFRNLPHLRFEHRIHEQILPAIRRAGGDVRFTDIHVVHSGSDHTPEGRQRKLERDFKLLHLDLAEHPDHPFVLFNLGMTHADCQQHEEAAYWLTRCLEVSRPEESHVRKAYALLVGVRYQQQRYTEALQICHQARETYANDKELLFRQAMLEHQLGHLDAAARNYETILRAPSERYFASVDAGITRYKARHNLALVYEGQGKADLARQLWQATLSEQPHYQPSRIALNSCLEGDRHQP